jgi:hypothetical protein
MPSAAQDQPRKRAGPVTGIAAEKGQQSKAERRDRRSGDQRQARAEAIRQFPRPSRPEPDNHRKRQQRRTGGRSTIAMHLDQHEWQDE